MQLRGLLLLLGQDRGLLLTSLYVEELSVYPEARLSLCERVCL